VIRLCVDLVSETLWHERMSFQVRGNLGSGKAEILEDLLFILTKMN
jgi:hypothetical protein